MKVSVLVKRCGFFLFCFFVLCITFSDFSGAVDLSITATDKNILIGDDATSFIVEAVGGTGGISWTLNIYPEIPGATIIPDSLNTRRATVSCKPTVRGTYTATLRVQDTSGKSVEKIIYLSTLQVTDVEITTGIHQRVYTCDTYGNYIVWDEGDASRGMTDICIYDISSQARQYLTIPGRQEEPRIYGNKVIFNDYTANSYKPQLYMYTISGNTKKITQGWQYAQTYFHSVTDKKVVWLGGPSSTGYGNAVFSYDIASGVTKTLRSGDKYYAFNDVDAYGNYAIYDMAGTGSQTGLYLHDGTSQSRKTECKSNPRIYDKKAVWEKIGSWPQGYPANSIELCENITSSSPSVIKLIDAPVAQNDTDENPLLYGDKIFWKAYRGKDTGKQYQVHYYDIRTGQTFKLVRHSVDILPGGIYGNRMVYKYGLNLGNVEDIRMLTLNISPVINNINPASSTPASSITINGANFGYTRQSGSYVDFNGVQASDQDIISWEDTKIVCKVPPAVVTGPVKVFVDTVPSNAVNLVIYDPAPTGIAAVYDNINNQITVTWQDNAVGEAYYYLGILNTTDIAYEMWQTLPANTQSYTFTPNKVYKNYRFRVKVRIYPNDILGKNPAYANVYTAYLGPTNLAGAYNPAQKKVNLTWTNHTTNAINYLVYKSDNSWGTETLVATLGPAAASYQDNVVVSGKTYVYRVEVKLAPNDAIAKCVDPVVAVVKIEDKPFPPTFLRGTTSSGQHTLYWQDNSNIENGFRIYRASSSSPQNFSLLKTVGANVTNSGVIGSGSTKYRYKVVAYNAYGESTPVIIDYPITDPVHGC